MDAGDERLQFITISQMLGLLVRHNQTSTEASKMILTSFFKFAAISWCSTNLSRLCGRYCTCSNSSSSQHLHTALLHTSMLYCSLTLSTHSIVFVLLLVQQGCHSCVVLYYSRAGAAGLWSLQP